MVTTTFDRPRTITTRKRVRVRLDAGLVIGALAAAAFGVLMVYTATRGTLLAQGLSPHYYLERQAIFVVLGLAFMVAMGVLDYRRLEQVAMLLYGLSVFSLLVVLSPIGSHALGSQRWFALGPIQLQPSEFAVLGLIIGVGTYCARRSEDGLTWRDIFKVLAMGAVPIGLVIVQPDLGTAIIMVVVLFVMLAVAGVPGRVLVLLLIGGVAVIALALEAGFVKHYQLSRITSFLQQDVKHPSYAQATDIYNLQQAKDAIGAGGLTGTGILHGSQTNLGYVPEQQTDFIFTAVGEQLGFVGSTIVLAGLGFIAWRFLRTAQLARDSFGRLLCAGLFTLFAFSVFENAGMTMGIMPITGIPLPFLSYGGSAAIVFFSAVGICLSVYARRSG